MLQSWNNFFLRPASTPGALLVGCCLALALASAPTRAQSHPSHGAHGWQASWTSAQTAPYGTEVLDHARLEGATLREVVHLSAGGKALRLRLSNRFGEGALQLRSVHIARRLGTGASARIDPATDHLVPFAGATAVSLPAGAEYLSDSVPFPVTSLSDLVVTLVLDHVPQIPTLHAGAHATAFLAEGDHAAADAELPSPLAITRWYFLSGVEVAAAPDTHGTLVAFGDSITDGHGSTLDGNDRWPDLLAARLSHSGAPMAVANTGIGGNRLLDDGIGPNALARFTRDALDIAGARTVLVLEGINDLGTFDRTAEHPAADHAAHLAQIEAALLEMTAEAHARGLRLLGATLTPFVGSDYYHPSPATEGDRQQLNTWIRTSHAFDGVVDFDLALRDPAHPDRLLPAFDSGDHLHPGPAGYRRMADTVPLTLLP